MTAYSPKAVGILLKPYVFNVASLWQKLNLVDRVLSMELYYLNIVLIQVSAEFSMIVY